MSTQTTTTPAITLDDKALFALREALITTCHPLQPEKNEFVYLRRLGLVTAVPGKPYDVTPEGMEVLRAARAPKKPIEVTEVKGVFPPPEKRLYEFVVTALYRHNGVSQPGPDGGFYVEARGPRGSTMATVYGDVTEKTVIGARFWRS